MTTEAASTDWKGPLEGLKVLDFTRVLAGPFCTQILGDLGADIIKVEPPGHGDDTRTYAPFKEGESHYFVAINRSKRGMVLDLKSPGGRSVAIDLVRKVDIVVENFRPGVMTRLGLGYETLEKINPRLIYCAISGFGLTGPLRDKPSFDIVTQALTGAMSVNGEQGRLPVKLGLPLGDMVGGVFGPIAILSAVHERSRTGKGRLIDVSLYDGLMGMLGYLPQLHFFTGWEPSPFGSSHPNIVPYGAFEAADGPIVIACLTEAFWVKLAQAIGRPELAEHPHFATVADRVRNRTALDAILAEAIRARTVSEWEQILETADVPQAPVLQIGDALSHPHAQAREMIVTVEHGRLGPMPVVGRPIKFPGETQPQLAPPPLLGEHSIAIMRDELGYSDERIRELIECGDVKAAGQPSPPTI